MDNQRMQEIHEMSDKLKSMGFTEENIKALYEIALDTADKIIKES